MSISIRATSTDGNPGGTSLSINLPTGTTTGDLTLIFLQSAVVFAAFTGPTGWTLLAQAAGGAIYYRAYQSGDPTSVSFTSSITGYMCAAAVSYIGCDTSNPIDGVNWAAAALIAGSESSTFSWAPEIISQYNGGLLVAVFAGANGSGTTFSTPSGFTARVSSNPGPTTYVFDQTFTTGGLFPLAQSTVGSSGQVRAGFQFALKASGATAASSAPGVVTLAGIQTGSNLNILSGATGHNVLAMGAVPGDLVVVILGCAGGLTGPQNFATALTGSIYGVFARTLNSGDSTVVAAGTTYIMASGASAILVDLYLFRAINTTQYAALSNTSAAGASTTNPSTGIVAPSIVPATPSDLLLLYYVEQTGNSEGTWTAPTGTNLLTQCKNSPNSLSAFLENCPNPSTARTATGTLTSVTAAYGLALDVTLSASKTGTPYGSGGAAAGGSYPFAA